MAVDVEADFAVVRDWCDDAVRNGLSGGEVDVGDIGDSSAGVDRYEAAVLVCLAVDHGDVHRNR